MRKIFAVLAALICCLSVWTSVPAAQAFTLDKEDGGTYLIRLKNASQDSSA